MSNNCKRPPIDVIPMRSLSRAGVSRAMLKYPAGSKKASPIKRLAFDCVLRFAYAFGFCLISAWAAARRAMGTRNGEQET